MRAIRDGCKASPLVAIATALQPGCDVVAPYYARSGLGSGVVIRRRRGGIPSALAATKRDEAIREQQIEALGLPRCALRTRARGARHGSSTDRPRPSGLRHL